MGVRTTFSIFADVAVPASVEPILGAATGFGFDVVFSCFVGIVVGLALAGVGVVVPATSGTLLGVTKPTPVDDADVDSAVAAPHYWSMFPRDLFSQEPISW